MSAVHSVTASAPGKTNLFFAVGPLQPDGFHDVASIYLALDLREEVTVSPAAEWSVSVSGNVSVEQLAAVPTGPENLVVKAAKRVAELAGCDAQPVAFAIDKHVPVAGGMGGGSADAAAALVAVDSLWCTGVAHRLVETVDLGADVPFAVKGGIVGVLGGAPEVHPIAVRGSGGLSGDDPALAPRTDDIVLIHRSGLLGFQNCLGIGKLEHGQKEERLALLAHDPGALDFGASVAGGPCGGPCGVPCGGPCGVPCGGPCGGPCGVQVVPCSKIVRVSLGDIDRSNRVRISHQVLHLPCTPHRVKPDLAIMAFDRTQAPQRIVEPVAVENRDDSHRLIVGFRLAEMPQKFRPAVGARMMGSDFVKRRLHYSSPV